MFCLHRVLYARFLPALKVCLIVVVGMSILPSCSRTQDDVAVIDDQSETTVDEVAREETPDPTREESSSETQPEASMPVPAADFMRAMQLKAVEDEEADWVHWGDDEARFSNWTYHSNRLIPVYTFGMSLESVTGENSCYRDEDQIKEIYGRLPDETLNPSADYFDQTEIMQLQERAFANGKKNVILIVFDGMDWDTTRSASIHKNKNVMYENGFGSGLGFLDYAGCEIKDIGCMVTSPHNSGTKHDVNLQSITNEGGDKQGGYSVAHGGEMPWSTPADPSYLIGNNKPINHVVTDSASSATSMTSGIKTFNGAINVGPDGKHVEPIARRLKDEGYAIGVVTSVPIAHATPSAAYGNNVNRNDYQDLCRDMVGLNSISHREGPLDGVDVLIGCGWGELKDEEDEIKEEIAKDKQGENFVPGNRYLPDDELESLRVENGGRYVVATRTEGAEGNVVLSKAADRAAAGGHRLFGFFGIEGGHLPYQTADGNYDPTRGMASVDVYTPEDITENPTLADMTTAALKVLETNEKGFWLMIEAGDVDWANHNNNLDDAIGAVLSGDDAFTAVTDWVEANSSWNETAVILTADHGHMLVLENPEALTGE